MAGRGRPKSQYEKAMVRVPGELVAPVRALIKAHIEQKRLARKLELEQAKQRKAESKP